MTRADYRVITRPIRLRGLPPRILASYRLVEGLHPRSDEACLEPPIAHVHSRLHLRTHVPPTSDTCVCVVSPDFTSVEDRVSLVKVENKGCVAPSTRGRYTRRTVLPSATRHRAGVSHRIVMGEPTGRCYPADARL